MAFSGAGDEIRTHDPNLGKVVLYPELRPHRRNSDQSESRFMHHRHEFDKPCPAAISGVGNRCKSPILEMKGTSMDTISPTPDAGAAATISM